MNRFQLVQVSAIIVALCLGYNGISYTCWSINQLLMSFTETNSNILHYVFTNTVSALLFFTSFFIILNKTSTIASWVLSKTDLDPDVKLNISVTSFLLGIIVFWSLKVLFESGAEIIAYMINSFYGITSQKMNRWEGTPIVSSFIKFIAGIFLLRYAKPISQYFEKQTDEDDPHQIAGDVVVNDDL